jgi:hypothetical protein
MHVQAVTLKMTSCKNHEQKQKVKKKWEPKILWEKQTYFFSTLPYSPWVVLAT